MADFGKSLKLNTSENILKILKTPKNTPGQNLEKTAQCSTKLIQLNPLRVNFTKWSNTLKQIVGNLLTNFLSVLEHFVGLALKGLTIHI